MFANVRVTFGQFLDYLREVHGRKSSENRHTVVINMFMLVRIGNYAAMLISSIYYLSLAPSRLQNQFNGSFSDGDFVDISASTGSVPELNNSTVPIQDQENDTSTEEQTPKLFTCLVDGCVKCFQQYGSLENHLQYGTCKLVPERENLFDKAKISYRDKLLHDRGIQPVLASSTLPVPAEETKPKGWVLKVTKKATRFNEKQKKHTSKKSFS